MLKCCVMVVIVCIVISILFISLPSLNIHLAKIP